MWFYFFSRDLFCQAHVGSILHTVQMAKVFPDSKTFVDMKMMKPQTQIEDEFKDIIAAEGDNLAPEVIRKFVEDNFTLENQMEDYVPADWFKDPSLVSRIADSNYSQFAADLHDRWKILCRKIKDDVYFNQDRYSLLYLPHPVVVPGGRFREIYYWDTFWVIRGLIQSEMYDTVKGMLLNFVHLIKQFGMIPNGGRSYYLNRSQPPMFIQMVQEYLDATGDAQFVLDNIEAMETELSYWYNQHSVQVFKDGEEHTLFRYNCNDDGPRPESYLEDFELAHETRQGAEEINDLYKELKTGAETGWDYSSRWFIGQNKCNVGNLQDTKARSIIPVDLNSIMAHNAAILADMWDVYFNDVDKSKHYANLAFQIKKGIEAVLWNDKEGVWFDFDLDNNIHREFYNPANLWPLWSKSYDTTESNKFASSAVRYLKKQNLQIYPGGVPTTHLQTGQQWDFPNCWPPLEHMLVKGLRNCDDNDAKQLAYDIAARRVNSSYVNFMGKGHMFEKYDATSLLKVGGGGEYEIQIGFGWSNGVVLDFLDMYKDELTSN